MNLINHNKKLVYKTWFILFAAAFVIGILLMNSLEKWFVNEEGIFNTTVMNRLRYMEVDSSTFFIYVIKKRMKDFLVIGILSMTCLGVAAIYINIIWQGLLSGMMLTAVFIKFGIKGIFFIMAGVFPHQLLLIPAGIMMLAWCYQNSSFTYGPGRYEIGKVHRGKQQYVRQGFLLLWILSMVLIGCVLECYVNPILISDIVKII